MLMPWAGGVVDEGNIANYPAYATCQGCVPGGDILVGEMCSSVDSRRFSYK